MLVELSLLIKTAALVMADGVPSGVNTAVIPGRSFGDMEPILDYTARLYREGVVKYIILPGVDGQQFGKTEKYVANVGRSAWSGYLNGCGVDVDKAVFFSGAGYHTRAETDAQLDFLFTYKDRLSWVDDAVENGVMVIAHPQQLPRAILGIIDQLSETGRRLKVHADYPPKTDWNAVIKGPQGAESKQRRDNIKDEFSRIPLYQKKGDLASYEDLLDYYRWRDGSLDGICLGILRIFSDKQSRRDWNIIRREIECL